MKKILLFVLFILLVTFVWKVESRFFYCLKNGNCVTVWKAYNGRCYVIPGRYNGIFAPSSQSYIITPYSKGMDIIYQQNFSAIIVNLEDEKTQIIHNSHTGIQIINYNSNKKYNDKLFLNSVDGYQRYRKNIYYITLNIKEEYAYGNDGKML